MPTARSGAARIHYELRGRGPPALLFNHTATSHLSWSEVFLEALATELTVITPDHRGTGGSSPAEQGLTLKLLAEDGAAVLDATSIADPVVVLGASMGGAVAQEFALRFPERVHALVLMGTFAGTPRLIPPEERVLRRVAEAGRLASRVERMRHMLPTIYAPGYLERNEALVLELELKGEYANAADTLRWHGEATRAFDAYHRLPGVRVPALVVHGDEDPIIPLANGRLLAERIPGARLVVLEGVGHLPAVEVPADSARLVLEFLRKNR